MTTLTKQISHVDADIIDSDVTRALEEDIGNEDVTAQLVANKITPANIISRENAVLCGTDWFDAAFKKCDPDCSITWHKKDGDHIKKDDIICDINGKARALLSAERTALNFLQTLSATATTTAQYVDAVKHTSSKILDTRKTLPGLRMAQKYAVHCGGGNNHRCGLYDMVLIKENHIAAAGSITHAITQARQLYPQLPIETEVETLDQLHEALQANANRILLDNMTPELLSQAVDLNAGQAELEASGNITLDNISAIAQTGVDYISLGALTKHVRAIDFSLLVK